MGVSLEDRAFTLTYNQIGKTCLCMQENNPQHARKCKFFYEIYESNLRMIKKLINKKIYRRGYTTKKEYGVKENEERT